MIVSHPSEDSLKYIAQSLRESDLAAVAALDKSLYDVERACEACHMGWMFSLDSGEPVYFYGLKNTRGAVWNVSTIATDKFQHIVLSLTKYIQRVIVPSIIQVGAGRVECFSLDGQDVTQKWLERLGMRREATFHKYGKNGEDFHVYAWLKGDPHNFGSRVA